MEYANLGRSGVQVSRICLGTMNFGRCADAATAHQIMDHALDAGVNFVDTADVYGRPRAEGVTEQIVGDWLNAAAGRRDKIVLATKLYLGQDQWPNDRFLSAVNIRRCCDASLRRLGTDRVDLYQMHHVDRSTPWEEIWEAMAVLRAQGKIIYVGSSNFAGWHIAKAQETARRLGQYGLVSEQSVYNLAARTVELEVLPACRDYGLGMLPWSPLNGGMLSGILAVGPVGPRRGEGRCAADLPSVRPQLEAYEALCGELGVHPAQAGLAWLLRQPGVTAPIVGPRVLEHLSAAVSALRVRLDDEALGALDKIFPGPGPAPEAYAW